MFDIITSSLGMLGMKYINSCLMAFSQVHVTETDAKFTSSLKVIQSSPNLDNPAIVKSVWNQKGNNIKNNLDKSYLTMEHIFS